MPTLTNHPYDKNLATDHGYDESFSSSNSQKSSFSFSDLTSTKPYELRAFIDEVVMTCDSPSGLGSFSLSDLRYSVYAMVDSSGVILERYQYDPYGKRKVMNAGYVSIDESAIGQEFGYTGRRHDSEGTGLMYFRARYYSVDLGRFVGRDPLGTALDVNYRNRLNRLRAGSGYKHGLSLYGAYFTVNGTDSMGMEPWNLIHPPGWSPSSEWSPFSENPRNNNPRGSDEDSDSRSSDSDVRDTRDGDGRDRDPEQNRRDESGTDLIPENPIEQAEETTPPRRPSCWGNFFPGINQHRDPSCPNGRTCWNPYFWQ